MDTITELNEAVLAAWSRARNEPQWLTDFRCARWRDAQQLPMPRREKTRLDGQGLERCELSAAPSSTPLPNALRDELGRSGAAAFIDGKLKETSLEGGAGMQVYDFETALSEQPELLRSLLERQAPADKLEAVALALCDGGAIVKVGRGVRAEAPITLLMHAARSGYPFVGIWLEELAELSLVHSLTSQTGDVTLNGSLTIVLQNGASLRYASLQSLEDGTRAYLPRRGFVERDARLDWTLAEIGGAFSIVSQDTHLIGDGSSSESVQVFFGSQKESLDIVAAMHHVASQTSSNIMTHGVLKDSAHCGYVALTDIHKGAHGTSGWQHENTLMLSEGARADLIPWLDISDADVSAGHAATAGQINQEQMFYLRSRGLTEKEAQKLIVFGFLTPVLAKIPLERVREEVSARIEERLMA